MILYLSSAIEEELFAEYLAGGAISGGHQAQKFNSLVIKGLAGYTQVKAVANPPYTATASDMQTGESEKENVRYVCLGTHKGKLHKVKNFLTMYKWVKRFCKGQKPQAIVCDAINSLASLCAVRAGKKFRVPKVAIVTDIPEYLDPEGKSVFTKITSKWMKKYEGYVLLTEAMNGLVNPKNKPYIIMEGLCDGNAQGKEPSSKNEKFICVYTGSLSKGTGIEELVEAFQKINGQGKEIELHVYGNGELADTIKEIALNTPNVKYMGLVNNRQAVAAQRAADLLINPRPADISYGNLSFPSKVMEYMVSGTPLLTTRLPGIPKEYFEYVYTIDKHTAQGIAEAVLAVYAETQEERSALGGRAREFVLLEKNNRKQAQRILALIGEIER